ncbi:MAG: DUF502 domain-containing protein, partial [Elusimicrobia bacterium]|nr:DUF502 domain-containing protein [Elusimicrobiota bacterium]
LFVIIPITLTFLVVVWFVNLVDTILAPLILKLLGHPLPGLGLITALLLLLFVGFLASHVIGQKLLHLADEILFHIPFLNWIYKTFKGIVDAFSPANKTSFKSVVIVEYPRPEVFCLGFATNEIVLTRNGRKEAMISVYIPTNHVYLGEYALFAKDEVIHTHLSIQEGIQCALSAGSAIPKELP